MNLVFDESKTSFESVFVVLKGAAGRSVCTLCFAANVCFISCCIIEYILVR